MISLDSINSRFKIGTRINFGFMTVLALLLVVAGVGYFGLNGSGNALHEYVRISDNSVKVRPRLPTCAATRSYADRRRRRQRVRDMTKTQTISRPSRPAPSTGTARDEDVALASQFTANFELIVKSRAERDRAVNG
jgi:methyl-accepting chemotaxis protein